MTLVERFIEFERWPTSRKTVLLTVLALPTHLAIWLLAHAAFASTATLDIGLFDAMWAGGAVAIIVCLILSLIAVRFGKEAHWTAYSMVVLYGGFNVTLIHALGLWSTSFFVSFPLAVLLVALWYGERVGWVGLIYGLLLIGPLSILVIARVLPFAPALLDRSLDAQLSAAWAVGMAAQTIVYFLFCFVLSVLIVAARRLQDTRLLLAQSLIRRYVPAQIADAILTGGTQVTDRHERRKLTIFFSDIVGFTDISEELEPEDLSRVLNEYFSEMTAIAQKHGGTVDELSGDAILILFGAPHATDDKDHAVRAVLMAIDMQRAMSALNAEWKGAGITETLQVRMGINTGLVTVGNFGSPDRMKYAALGKHVNLAARIQSQCEPGKILLSHATWLLVQDQLRCEPRGEMQFKGILKPVLIYEAGDLAALLPARAQPALPADGLAPLDRR